MASLILFSAQLPFLMMVLQKVQLKKEFYGLSSPVVHLMNWPLLCAGNKALICRGYSCQDVYHSGLYITATVLVLKNNERRADALHRCQVLGMQLTQIVALAGVSRAPHFLSFEPPLPSWSDLLTHISSRFHSFHSALISTAISLFRSTWSSDKWRLFVTFNN